MNESWPYYKKLILYKLILYKIRNQTAIILHSLWCIIFSYVNKEIILIQVFVIEKKQILNISQNIKLILKYPSKLVYGKTLKEWMKYNDDVFKSIYFSWRISKLLRDMMYIP